MAERCAVIGVGQTHHKSRRDDVSIAGLVREAAQRALADAGVTCRTSTRCARKAPNVRGCDDARALLAPALGASGKPIFRVHTAARSVARPRWWRPI